MLSLNIKLWQITSSYDNLSAGIHEDLTDKDSVDPVPEHPIMT
jgi:hypothetical protein